MIDDDTSCIEEQNLSVDKTKSWAKQIINMNTKETGEILPLINDISLKTPASALVSKFSLPNNYNHFLNDVHEFRVHMQMTLILTLNCLMVDLIENY